MGQLRLKGKRSLGLAPTHSFLPASLQHPPCFSLATPPPTLYPMVDLVLTLEQRVQQVLTDSFGASMIDQEACTKANQ